MLLKLEPDIDIVGTAEDGAEAVDMVAERDRTLS
jgi:DNA-binding NarL/FixJ family response regulator